MIESACGCFASNPQTSLFMCPCGRRLPWRRERRTSMAWLRSGRSSRWALTLRCNVNILVIENPSQVLPCSKVWKINSGSLKAHIQRRRWQFAHKRADGSRVVVSPQSQMDHSARHYFPLGPDKWVLTCFSVQISCCYHSHYCYQDQTICPATMSEKQRASSFQTTAWVFKGTRAQASDRVTESSTISIMCRKQFSRLCNSTGMWQFASVYSFYLAPTKKKRGELCKLLQKWAMQITMHTRKQQLCLQQMLILN